MQRRAQKILTVALLASATSFASLNVALAHPEGPHAEDAIQNARNNMPTYGGASSSGYRPHGPWHGMGPGVSVEGGRLAGVAEDAVRKAIDSVKKTDNPPTDKCPPSAHGTRSTHQHEPSKPSMSNGSKHARTTPVTLGNPPADTNKGTTSSSAPKNNMRQPASNPTPASGAPTSDVPQPPDVLTPKEKPFGHFRYDRPAREVDYTTAGMKGGFSDVGGLELETQPIEYRDGADSEYNKTKQPGLPKYSDITMKRPTKDDGFSEEILREMRFRVELEELKTEHFPERQKNTK